MYQSVTLPAPLAPIAVVRPHRDAGKNPWRDGWAVPAELDEPCTWPKRTARPLLATGQERPNAMSHEMNHTDQWKSYRHPSTAVNVDIWMRAITKRGDGYAFADRPPGGTRTEWRTAGIVPTRARRWSAHHWEHEMRDAVALRADRWVAERHVVGRELSEEGPVALAHHDR